MDNFIFNTFMDSYDVVVKMNTKTNEFYFYKNTFFDIPEKTLISRKEFRANYFSKLSIYPPDLYLFSETFDEEAFAAKLSSKSSQTLFSYRLLNEDKYIWETLSLFIPSDYSEEKPDVILCQKSITSTESDMVEAIEIFARKIYKIIKINLNEDSIRIVKQRKSEDYIKRKYTTDHLLENSWLIEEGLIHPDDLKIFKHYIDGSFLKNYFSAGNEDLSFFYRRKIGNIFRWVRGYITRSTEYSKGSQVFTFIIENIDKSLTRLFDKQNERLSIANNDYFAEAYQNGLSNIITYFTQKYKDFYMIDFKNDLCISYKIRPDLFNSDRPLIGPYSDVVNLIAQNTNNISDKEYIKKVASIESLTTLLKDKTSFEYAYKGNDRKNYKTIITKIESEKGIVTKAICATLPYTSDNLLKIQTFGNFDVFSTNGERIKFTKKQSKQLLAYLIDKHGFPVATKDIVTEVLEKQSDDKNAIKYVSRLSQLAIKDLESYGYTDIIIKEWNSLRVNVEKVDCDYYHLINGDNSYFHQYHNEYMKEYSWAEETNSEILHYSIRD